MQLKYTYNSVFPGLQPRAPLPVYYHGANLKGFNGMEKDDELKGAGNSYDFGARLYDSRLGRWLTRDPLELDYPYFSTFVFVGNTSIQAMDPDGERIVKPKDKEARKNYNAQIKVLKKSAIFKQMYKELKRSETVIYVNQHERRNSNERTGQESDEELKDFAQGYMLRNEDGSLTVSTSGESGVAIVQELWGAYQHISENSELYKGITATDKEVEGEVATYYIMHQVAEKTGNQNYIYTPMGQFYIDKEGKSHLSTLFGTKENQANVPSSEEINSDEYNTMYQDFKTAFVGFNKMQPGAPPSYTGRTTDSKPVGLTKLIEATEKKR